MGTIEIIFHDDARLTVTGSTYLGTTVIYGYGILDADFRGSTFHGDTTAIFNQGGSLNFNASTFLGRTAIEHHGQFQNSSTGCTYKYMG